MAIKEKNLKKKISFYGKEILKTKLKTGNVEVIHIFLSVLAIFSFSFLSNKMIQY